MTGSVFLTWIFIIVQRDVHIKNKTIECFSEYAEWWSTAMLKLSNGSFHIMREMTRIFFHRFQIRFAWEQIANINTSEKGQANVVEITEYIYFLWFKPCGWLHRRRHINILDLISLLLTILMLTINTRWYSYYHSENWVSTLVTIISFYLLEN